MPGTDCSTAVGSSYSQRSSSLLRITCAEPGVRARRVPTIGTPTGAAASLLDAAVTDGVGSDPEDAASAAGGSSLAGGGGADGSTVALLGAAGSTGCCGGGTG